MDLEKRFEVNEACWRTGHEYHEGEGDTLKPRRLQVYPGNQTDCKQPWRFVLDQLPGQHQALPDTRSRVKTRIETPERNWQTVFTKAS